MYSNKLSEKKYRSRVCNDAAALIFSFSHSGNEQSAALSSETGRNFSRIPQNVENESVVMGIECLKTRLLGS